MFFRTTYSIFVLGVAMGCIYALTACHQRISEFDPSPSYNEQPINSRPFDKTGIEEFADRLEPVDLADLNSLSKEGIRKLSADNSPEVLDTRAQLSIAQANLKSVSTWSNPHLEARLLSTAQGDILNETGLTFSLPIGGRVSASEAEAVAKIQLVRQNLASARKKAIWQADLLMALLAHQRARLELLKKLSLRSKSNADLASSRLQASLADSVDVTLLLAEAAKDRRTAVRAQADITQTEHELKLILGLAPQGNHQFRVDALAQFRLRESEEKLKSDSQKSHPAILRAKLRLALADRHAARVAAERVPDLEIGPALASAPDETAVGVQLGLELPLFSTGSAQYQEALARRHAALSAYQQVCRTTASNVSSHLSQLASLADEMLDFSIQPKQLIQNAIALAEEQYAAGKSDVLRLLSVHRAQVTLEAEYLDLLLAANKALINLELAVGRPVLTEEVTK